MLPLNIGLPKTPNGLSIDRCLEPCPSFIPKTDQPRFQPRPLSPDPVLPQHWSNQDYQALTQCYLNTGPIKTSESLPAFWCLSWGGAETASPDGRHHQFQLQWVCHPVVLFLGYSEITGGFRVLAPFTKSGSQLILSFPQRHPSLL